MSANDTKSVLHVLPHPGGGGETYTKALSRMDGYRFDRMFLAPDPTAALAALRTGARVPLASRRYDLVHVHGEVAAGICLPSLALRRSLVTVHGLNLIRRVTGARRAVATANLRLVVRAASRMICVSEAERAEVCAAVGPICTERVTTIHNGVDLIAVPTAVERATAREALGIDTDTSVGAFVGTLEEHKDPLVAARAAVAVAAEGSPIVLLVAGDGPLRTELAILARESRGAVRALGFCDDVETILRASDFFVLPSWREGFSYAVLEAMALGIPTVVSDAPANAEAVGDTGIVVSRGDTDGFANAFRRLLDLRVRHDLGARARERVRGEFGLDEMVRRTQEVYDEVMTTACRVHARDR
jgi:glycosyltransferase involved in cell wall biosynthesis